MVESTISQDSLNKFFSEEALKFKPSEIDVFVTNSKGERQRLIFHEPRQLLDYET